MIAASLIHHSEKVAFLTNYLNGTLQDFDHNQPLMIIGSGGNGKSFVFNEVLKTSPVNILLLSSHENRYSIYSSRNTSSKTVILMIENGTPEDFELAHKLNAKIVEFKKDPTY